MLYRFSRKWGCLLQRHGGFSQGQFGFRSLCTLLVDLESLSPDTVELLLRAPLCTLSGFGNAMSLATLTCAVSYGNRVQFGSSYVCILCRIYALGYFYSRVSICYVNLCAQEALLATMAGAGDKACSTPTAMSTDGYNPTTVRSQVTKARRSW